MATLQARLAQGDATAFAELYDACAARVGHYLLVCLHSREDADDVLQETFLRLARIRQKLAKVDDLDAYVITIARNEAARRGARNARRQQKQKPLNSQDVFCTGTSDVEIREIAEFVTAALEHLDLELREVVELKTYAGLTFQQISQVTRLPQGTVATRYRSALAKMQSWLRRQP
jgi:RNA polymerase sigma-70 factor, ECF subfamily